MQFRSSVVATLFVLALSLVVTNQLSLSNRANSDKKRQHNLSKRGSDVTETHPVQDFMQHNYEGAYVDQVEGGDFTCQPDITFVLDFSNSIGVSWLHGAVFPIMETIMRQLARLPSSPGDSTFGSALGFVYFNKVAHALPLETRGKSNDDIRAQFEKLIPDEEETIDGGTCISCGLDLGRKQLMANDDGSGTHNKYIVLISDGMDNDIENVSPDSPIVTASENRQKDGGIYHLVIGINGQKNRMNETLLRLISNTPDEESFWMVESDEDVKNVPIELTDTIAGASCMGFENA